MRTEGDLHGCRILLTRPEGRGTVLRRRLESLGAAVTQRPTIAFAPADDEAAALAAVEEVERYDWVVFTSPTGVASFFGFVARAPRSPRRLPPLAAVGAGTARALERHGERASVVAATSHAEGLATALEGRVSPGSKVLLVRPEAGRPVLAERLRALGARVTETPFYRTVAGPGCEDAAAEIGAGTYDAVVFSSPSTLSNLVDAGDRLGLGVRDALARTAVVAIGEVTERALCDAGLVPAAVAVDPGEEGLVDALRTALERRDNIAAPTSPEAPTGAADDRADASSRASSRETGLSSPVQETPLHDAHVAAGGRMVDFAGWRMPVQYSGVLEEHQAVRTRAGLFDVSHMGEASVRGPQALDFLQRTTCNDVSRLRPGRAQYTGLMTPEGTFVDDLLIYQLADDDYLLVINAANTPKDVEWLLSKAADLDVEVTDASAHWAQLALQGPEALAILAPLVDASLDDLKYYRFVRADLLGSEWIVSRTGYTGEDGFELYGPPAAATDAWDALLERGTARGLIPAGLAARDTLRLEARMALYGNDIDETTTAYEADLGWIVKLGKGEFIGRDVLARQAESGVARKLIGFEMRGRGIARHGYAAYHDDQEVGRVTSGSFAPFLKKNIGLAYLPVQLGEPGTLFEIEIRGRRQPAEVVATPFYKRKRQT